MWRVHLTCAGWLIRCRPGCHDPPAENRDTDTGKVGIPDRILLKLGRFEPEESEIMKSHSQLGQNAIEQAEQKLGMKVDFLTMDKDIALYHHEKWDGSGYLEGLSGEAIPLSARCTMP